MEAQPASLPGQVLARQHLQQGDEVVAIAEVLEQISDLLSRLAKRGGQGREKREISGTVMDGCREITYRMAYAAGTKCEIYLKSFLKLLLN